MYSFFAANPVPSSERRIGQSVESIRSTGNSFLTSAFLSNCCDQTAQFLSLVARSELSTERYWRSFDL
jgi:hypothetical protein